MPYQVFRAADAEFVIACGNDGQFRALCGAIGLPALPDHARFTRNRDRVAHREVLVPLLEGHFAQRPVAFWIAAIHAAGVPVGAINDVQSALAEPQVQARGMVVDLPHPLRRGFRMVGSPINLSDTPVQYRRPPPMLGEHTNEVLRRVLGLPDADIASLRARGAVA